jgi:hypothetical protein
MLVAHTRSDMNNPRVQIHHLHKSTGIKHREQLYSAPAPESPDIVLLVNSPLRHSLRGGVVISISGSGTGLFFLYHERPDRISRVHILEDTTVSRLEATV